LFFTHRLTQKNKISPPAFIRCGSFFRLHTTHCRFQWITGANIPHWFFVIDLHQAGFAAPVMAWVKAVTTVPLKACACASSGNAAPSLSQFRQTDLGGGLFIQ